MNKKLAASATLGAALLLAITAPLAASAHVRLSTNTAEAGSYTLLTFRVPNESATATTDVVTFNLPEATPFASVSYVPTPGWTAKLVSTKLTTPVKVGESKITDAVTSVVFTADAGASIEDGQLQLFSLSVGPVPDVDSVAITASQKYSDGSVVNWNDTSADADEPAPVLYVNAAPPADEGSTPTVTATAATSPTEDTLARIIGIAGLVVGVVGITLAIATRRQKR
jgi:uncharacterized protein YcnI